jgi:hypothetical protein
MCHFLRSYHSSTLLRVKRTTNPPTPMPRMVRQTCVVLCIRVLLVSVKRKKAGSTLYLVPEWLSLLVRPTPSARAPGNEEIYTLATGKPRGLHGFHLLFATQVLP